MTGVHEGECWGRVNDLRAEYGLGPLPYLLEHQDVASARASSQPLGSLDHLGSVSAENLALVPINAASAARAVEAWRGSEQHLANMLNTDYTATCIGYSEQEDGVYAVYAQLFQ